MALLCPPPLSYASDYTYSVFHTWMMNEKQPHDRVISSNKEVILNICDNIKNVCIMLVGPASCELRKLPIFSTPSGNSFSQSNWENDMWHWNTSWNHYNCFLSSDRQKILRISSVFIVSDPTTARGKQFQIIWAYFHGESFRFPYRNVRCGSEMKQMLFVGEIWKD